LQERKERTRRREKDGERFTKRGKGERSWETRENLRNITLDRNITQESSIFNLFICTKLCPAFLQYSLILDMTFFCEQGEIKCQP